MKKTLKTKLLKTILIFIIYYLYSQIFMTLFGKSILINFISDLLFLIGIVYTYRDNLKKSFKNLTKKNNLKKYVKNVFLWSFIILFVSVLLGILVNTLYPTLTLDNNTLAIDSLYNSSKLYAIFKTMIFAVVAEELLFRESIHDVIENKWFFVIFSGLIYTLSNFVWSGFSLNIFDYLLFFLPSILFSLAYIKNNNNNNIIFIMFVKFIYQLIPLILLIISK